MTITVITVWFGYVERATLGLSVQEVIVEMTDDDGVGGVDYSFECIGNVQVRDEMTVMYTMGCNSECHTRLAWPWFRGGESRSLVLNNFMLLSGDARCPGVLSQGMGPVYCHWGGSSRQGDQHQAFPARHW